MNNEKLNHKKNGIKQAQIFLKKQKLTQKNTVGQWQLFIVNKYLKEYKIFYSLIRNFIYLIYNKEKKVKTTSGTDIDVGCDIICVHSDTPNAVEIITKLKNAIKNYIKLNLLILGRAGGARPRISCQGGDPSVI